MGTDNNDCWEKERQWYAVDDLYDQGVAVLKLRRKILVTFSNRLQGPNGGFRGTCMLMPILGSRSKESSTIRELHKPYGRINIFS